MKRTLLVALLAVGLVMLFAAPGAWAEDAATDNSTDVTQAAGDPPAADTTPADDQSVDQTPADTTTTDSSADDSSADDSSSDSSSDCTTDCGTDTCTANCDDNPPCTVNCGGGTCTVNCTGDCTVDCIPVDDCTATVTCADDTCTDTVCDDTPVAGEGTGPTVVGGRSLPFTGISDVVLPILMGALALLGGVVFYRFASVRDALGRARDATVAAASRRPRSGFERALENLDADARAADFWRQSA